MGISRIIGGKPNLYHYTNPDALVAILSSQSLWATPTWGFKANDKDEYVYGLRIIASRLKQISFAGREREDLPASTVAMMSECGVNLSSIVQRTIANIEYELAHPDDPRVRVYVACLSRNPPSLTDPATARMLKQYGECVIQFNWMLPLLAYTMPKPFGMSMLSRVTYDTRDFQCFLPTAMDLREWFPDSKPFQEADFTVSTKYEREGVLANVLTVLLCIFAVNIKQREFEYEHEWRLKTVETAMMQSGGVHWIRQFFKLPEIAEFTSTDPRRYVQQITFQGRTIIHPGYRVLKQHPIPAEFADTMRSLERRLQEIVAKQGGVVGEATDLREELLRMEREGVGGLSPDKPIV